VYNLGLDVDCGGISLFVSLFKEILSIDLSGLPSGVINSIYKDKNGNLWFGTDSGIGFYDSVT